jgi:hypothetical protein
MVYNECRKNTKRRNEVTRTIVTIAREEGTSCSTELSFMSRKPLTFHNDGNKFTQDVDATLIDLYSTTLCVPTAADNAFAAPSNILFITRAVVFFSSSVVTVPAAASTLNMVGSA